MAKTQVISMLSNRHEPLESPKQSEREHLTRCSLTWLVEARGVEPLSENIATYASTGVVTNLMSPEHRPVTGYALGQPDYLLTSTPGGDRTAYPTKVGPYS